ncbi:hypothetical protein JTB14_023970 [Gonioctena quinquepunctata]|nr:hypothetical protein JTB14_023970 [Gonioctena quinquepunctata]
MASSGDFTFDAKSNKPPLLDMIEPNLYLAAECQVCDVDALKQHKITHILTISDHPLPRHVKGACPYLSIKFIMAYDWPSTDLLSCFDETYEFIKDGLTRGAVVVHCLMGMSRSATIVTAYLMKRYGLGYREALDKVKGKRMIRPIKGFIKQLEDYQKVGYSTYKCHSKEQKICVN